MLQQTAKAYQQVQIYWLPMHWLTRCYTVYNYSNKYSAARIFRYKITIQQVEKAISTDNIIGCPHN